MAYLHDPSSTEILYNQQAAQYDSCRGAAYYYFERHTVLHLLPNLSNLKVLDLACGSGLYTRDFVALGAHSVTGVDISEEMLNTARQHPDHCSKTIQYTHCDVCSWQPDDDYDFIFSGYLLSYAKNPKHLQDMVAAIVASSSRPVPLMILINLVGLRRAEDYGKNMEEFRIYHQTPRPSYEPFKLTMKPTDPEQQSIDIRTATIHPDECREALNHSGCQNIVMHPPFFHPDAWQHLKGKTISRMTTYPYCLIITANLPHTPSLG